jgi:hypothetical protein
MASAKQAQDIFNQRPIAGPEAKKPQDRIAFPLGTPSYPVISCVKQTNEESPSLTRIFRVRVCGGHCCSLQRLMWVIPLIGICLSPLKEQTAHHQMTIQTTSATAFLFNHHHMMAAVPGQAHKCVFGGRVESDVDVTAVPFLS